MPTPVLLVLIVLVGAYGVLAGAASIGFTLARREDPPPDPPEWPSISVVAPAANPAHARQQIEACDYPADRLEILVLAEGLHERVPSDETGEETIRHISGPERSSGPPSGSATLRHAIEGAEGEVVLSMPPEGTIPSGWIRSMVRRCSVDTPHVVGPTIIEHEGLFLPRLQALSHLGRLAFTGGASYVGVAIYSEPSNRAVHVDALSANRRSNAASDQMHEGVPPAFNPEPDAVVARRPVSSFEAFLQRLALRLRPALQSPSWLMWGQGTGLWLVHTALLACALVAVAVPAWRQPTLIALVAKMGADVVLSLPAAKHYGQRGLFRSLVPTELMLVVALPLAGLWALVNQFRDPTPEPHSET